MRGSVGGGQKRKAKAHGESGSAFWAKGGEELKKKRSKSKPMSVWCWCWRIKKATHPRTMGAWSWQFEKKSIKAKTHECVPGDLKKKKEYREQEWWVGVGVRAGRRGG